jgi:TrmH family RNA methyltransferase
MLTSTQNERVKYIRALNRRRVRQREGRFVVEGTRLVAEGLEAGVKPVLAFYTEAWALTPAGSRLLPRLQAVSDQLWLVSEEVISACAHTQTPQGVLLVLPVMSLPLRPGLILILDQIRDPGNLGTILRSAEAAGTGQVLLTPATVDLYNPKAVRGGMGAHFRLAVRDLDWPAIAAEVTGRAVWLAEANADMRYDQVDWTLPSALIVGGETAGLGQEARALATGRVAVPMAAAVESLNAAMAATVLLFEYARQQGAQP